MNRNILVTGAAGFIGSHTVQALLNDGHSVVGVDNFNSYYDPARKWANLAELRRETDTTDLTFHEGDVRDRAFVAELFKNHRFDAIVHLAAMAGVRASLDDPGLYFDVNVQGTLNLLDAAVGRLGRPRPAPVFVLASTSSAYGDTRVIPFVESDAADRPLAPYAASKRAAELLGHTYHRVYGLNFSALRFFTVYGPRNRPDMMAYKIMDNILFGRDVPLFNQGNLHRDWTYVEDIVGGVVAAACRPLGYEIINLGRGQPVLLADFVRLVEQCAGQDAQLTPAPMPDTDVAYTFASIDKARRLLGYHPQTSVAEGVARTWAWYQANVLTSASTPLAPA